jgi:hypothetical protein
MGKISGGGIAWQRAVRNKSMNPLVTDQADTFVFAKKQICHCGPSISKLDTTKPLIAATFLQK